MATATGLALRDDASGRSLSTNERSFLRSCVRSSVPVRADGRHPTEARPLRLTLSRSHGAAECTVRLGSGTRVTASVTCGLIPPPSRDRPNDGQVRFGVDLSPMSCPAFGGGGPIYSAGGSGGGGGSGGAAPPADDAQRLLSNRILRTLERTVLAGGAIDSEALCVQSGRWVWRLSVDVVCLDHGGNLVDASLLAAVAGLRHFRKPEVQVSAADDINTSSVGGPVTGNPVVLNSDEREPSPLPLHHTPLCVTFALFSDRDSPDGTGTVAALIDPTEREEMVADGMATLSYNKHGELCGLDFPGGTELRPSQLIQCGRLGEKRCSEWCSFLEDALTEADDKASKERMARLKAAAGTADNSSALLPAPDVADGVPFVERTDAERDGNMMEIDAGKALVEVGSDQARAAEEEERYRLRALDYTLGHVAAKVKEDGGGNSRQKASSGAAAPTPSSSLMSAMLKNVSSKPDVAPRNATDKKRKTEGSSARSQANTNTTPKGSSTRNVNLELDSNDDDDDEEELTTLQSEFASEVTESSVTENLKVRASKKKMSKPEKQAKEAESDDDIDDLAMAVVKKKHSKKSKKSKRRE